MTAAHAYSNIAEGVHSAKDFVDNSNEAASNATAASSGIDKRAGESDLNSRELLENARQALGVVQTDLQPHINNASAAVKKIQELNERSDDRTTAIQL